MAEAEAVLVAWAKAAFPAARVVTETPGNLGDLVAAGTPVIQVTGIGGSGETVRTFTNPRVDFDCYAKDRPTARTLAYDVRRALRDGTGQTFAGGFLSRVDNDTEPSQTPYDNTNLRRFTYSAQIRIHSLEA